MDDLDLCNVNHQQALGNTDWICHDMFTTQKVGHKSERETHILCLIPTYNIARVKSSVHTCSWTGLKIESLFLVSFFGTFPKCSLEYSVKKFQNDFLETSYPSKYWPEKYDLYIKWRLNNMQLADDVSFEIYFGKIGKIKFQKNNSRIFWQNEVFSWKVLKNEDMNRSPVYKNRPDA